MWVKGTPLHFIVDSGSHKNLISAERSSNSWDCRQHHTHSHTTSGGFAKDEIFVSANNVDCHTTSNPSSMRYYVMLPHWMSVMFSWANHICESAMLFMSLDPTVSLFLWGSSLQNTRGSFDYCSTKKVLQGSISYYKIQLLHNLFKR
jgi:hypothetical protein